jgi:hypothetical protein
MAIGIIPVEKLRTTLMGEERIRRNLGLDCDDVIAWCRSAIQNIPDESVIRKGKNWYVHGDGFVLTINASTASIITAHKTSRQTESCADEKASRRSGDGIKHCFRKR